MPQQNAKKKNGLFVRRTASKKPTLQRSLPRGSENRVTAQDTFFPRVASHRRSQLHPTPMIRRFVFPSPPPRTRRGLINLLTLSSSNRGHRFPSRTHTWRQTRRRRLIAAKDSSPGETSQSSPCSPLSAAYTLERVPKDIVLPRSPTPTGPFGFGSRGGPGKATSKRDALAAVKRRTWPQRDACGPRERPRNATPLSRNRRVGRRMGRTLRFRSVAAAERASAHVFPHCGNVSPGCEIPRLIQAYTLDAAESGTLKQRFLFLFVCLASFPRSNRSELAHF